MSKTQTVDHTALQTVTIAHSDGDKTYEIGFIAHPSQEGMFVPVFQGMILVKAPANEGHTLVGGLLPYFGNPATARKVERKNPSLKAAKGLYSGKFVLCDALTKGGKLKKGWEELVAKAHKAGGESRPARQAELAEVQAAAKAEKAEAKKAEAKAPRVDKTGLSPEMAFLRAAVEVKALIEQGVNRALIAVIFGVEVGLVDMMFASDDAAEEAEAV